MAQQQKNEGEGNKTAAREFNQAQTKFTQSGKVEPAAQKAKKAVDSSEGADLKKAEEEGRRHGYDAKPDGHDRSGKSNPRSH